LDTAFDINMSSSYSVCVCVCEMKDGWWVAMPYMMTPLPKIELQPPVQIQSSSQTILMASSPTLSSNTSITTAALTSSSSSLKSLPSTTSVKTTSNLNNSKTLPPRRSERTKNKKPK